MAAHDLTDYFIDLGFITIKTAGQVSGVGTVPESGKLRALVFNTEEEVTVAAASADILKNTADTAGVGATAVDVTFPIQAVNLGGEVEPGADVFVTKGDVIRLQANGESALGILRVIAIIRR